MARSILGHNLDAINEDGTVTPVAGEVTRVDESGHAVLAIGEYYRAVKELTLGDFDLVDLSARCLTAQAFAEEEGGLAFSALGLLSFGPSKERNPVWERLMKEAQECLDQQLLARTDYEDHRQAYNIAKAVTRFSMGLSKRDETGKLIDRFIERIQQSSSGGFVDDSVEGNRGAFDIHGALSFVFIRQALQLHANVSLRDRKLPSLRTYAEKYIKLLPDLVRHDGLGWAYGENIGPYGQMYCISIVLQALRDKWIPTQQKSVYLDILRRLFYFFFVSYLDQEHGFLVIRDSERSTDVDITTRIANFDAARYLCQWSRLATVVGGDMTPPPVASKTSGRFIVFDKTYKKEQGLFLYQDAKSGLQVQLPLIASKARGKSGSLAFPHSPGIFDWPADNYLPIMLPELTFGQHVILPSWYGKNCSAGLGIRKSFFFRFDQPELVSREGDVVPGLGSCKVNWSFAGDTVTSDFIFKVKNQVQLDSMRYILVLAMPHSRYRIGTTFVLGPESLRATVVKNDFQATWKDFKAVSDNPDYRTHYGNINYLQELSREHPLVMRPGQQYKLSVMFRPDIALADELS